MICPNCRACREADGDRYCRMCGADTLEPELASHAPAETVPSPARAEPDLSQLSRYWEGDVAHWLREGASPASLRAVVESAIRKAQEPRADD